MKPKTRLLASLFALTCAFLLVGVMMFALFVQSTYTEGNDISIDVKGFDATIEMMYFNPDTNNWEDVNNKYNEAWSTCTFTSLVPGDCITYRLKVSTTSNSEIRYNMVLNDFSLYHSSTNEFNLSAENLLVQSKNLTGLTTNATNFYISNAFRISMVEVLSLEEANNQAALTSDYKDSTGLGLGKTFSYVSDNKTYSNTLNLIQQATTGVSSSQDNYWIIKVYYDPILHDSYVFPEVSLQALKINQFQLIAG